MPAELERNFCFWGKARQRATQANPHHTTPGFGDFYIWRKLQIESRRAESTRRIENAEKKKGREEKYFVSLIT
jgi:hypothetical protein